jgi:hypothetical protein
MRTSLCNVMAHAIAERLMDSLAYGPDDEQETARDLAEEEWEQVEVPGNDYPRHWTRYENVTLDDAEVAYTAKYADELLAEMLAPRPASKMPARFAAA